MKPAPPMIRGASTRSLGSLLLLCLLAPAAGANTPGEWLKQATTKIEEASPAEALPLLQRIETQLGRPTPRVESLRVYALVAMEDWVQAKIALNRYKRLAPNATSPAHQALLKLEAQIDAGVAQLEATWKKEAAKRVENELKQLREADETAARAAEAALRRRAAGVEQLQARARTESAPVFVAVTAENAETPVERVALSITPEQALQLLRDRRELLAWFEQPQRNPEVEEALSQALRASDLSAVGFDPKEMMLKRGSRLLYALTRASVPGPEVVIYPGNPPESTGARAYQPDLRRVAGQGTGAPVTERLADFSRVAGYDILRFESEPGRFLNPKRPRDGEKRELVVRIDDNGEPVRGERNRGLVAKGALWIGGVPDRVPLIELAVWLKRGYELRHLSLHYGQWHAGFAVPPPELELSFKLNQPAPVSQHVLTGERFPLEEMRRLLGEGGVLRDVHHAGGQWIVIITKLPEGYLVPIEKVEPQPDDSVLQVVTAGSLEAALWKVHIPFYTGYQEGFTETIASLVKIQSNEDGSEWAVVYEQAQKTLKTTQLVVVDAHDDPLLEFLLSSGFRINFAAETKLREQEGPAIAADVSDSEPRLVNPDDRIVPPRILDRVPAIYPPELKRAGVTGSAKIRYSVTAKGEIVDASVIEATHPTFGAAALAANSASAHFPGSAVDMPTLTQVERVFTFGPR